mmetsp:Transcript_9998/g.15420  ORF Transcript_9998/g.15420 Transcript_9998/m.15420 type:complete len:87 (+) Transcript_9998:142-402(+)
MGGWWDLHILLILESMLLEHPDSVPPSMATLARVGANHKKCQQLNQKIHIVAMEFFLTLIDMHDLLNYLMSNRLFITIKLAKSSNS